MQLILKLKTHESKKLKQCVQTGLQAGMGNSLDFTEHIKQVRYPRARLKYDSILV